MPTGPGKYDSECAAIEKGDRDLALSFIKLVNRLNLGNPNYRPYSEEPLT